MANPNMVIQRMAQNPMELLRVDVFSKRNLAECSAAMCRSLGFRVRLTKITDRRTKAPIYKMFVYRKMEG